MSFNHTRTRFAPSPTGFMHIGNLRTALFEYLVAKTADGDFVLRIEDTDQGRLVEGSVDKIYATLKLAGLVHDEGPDIGGNFGPYVQSERLSSYKAYAEQLVESGAAYYCFCSSERLENLHREQKEAQADFIGYDGHCSHLSLEEARAKVLAGEPHVIRQRMPKEGSTGYDDAVYGRIEVENNTLEDQVLIKSDGFPTYNFANVVDDHAMQISHIVRGNEYLSSTPKYILLYEAFGYDVPTFVHLPLILGADGQKLSKRHGATTFEELQADGILPEAIINYLALLGWTPKSTRELFTLEELKQEFSIDGISKSPAIFDEKKLVWFNEQYCQNMSEDDFFQVAKDYLLEVLPNETEDRLRLIASLLKNRTSKLTDIKEQIAFLYQDFEVEAEMFIHKKSKSSLESSSKIIQDFLTIFRKIEWTKDSLHDEMVNYATSQELKNGTVMWPLRIGVGGQLVTPGGASDVLYLVGQERAIANLEKSLELIQATIEEGKNA